MYVKWLRKITPATNVNKMNIMPVIIAPIRIMSRGSLKPLKRRSRRVKAAPDVSIQRQKSRPV